MTVNSTICYLSVTPYLWILSWLTKTQLTMRTVMGLSTAVTSAGRKVSLEPVFFLYCVNIGLTVISTQGLYLDKTCKVNLNHTEEICDNIHDHSDIQKET